MAGLAALPSRPVLNGDPDVDETAGWVFAPYPPRPAANQLPGRGFPQVPGSLTGPATGGAHGPAAIPSRLTEPVGPAPPATAGGAWGPSAVTRRGPAWVGPKYSPGNQELGQDDNTLLHNSIAWDRPRYPNDEGLRSFVAPTNMPSWTADSAYGPGGPTVPVPVQEKSIANFTVRRPFGDTSTGELTDASYGQPTGIPIALPYYGTPDQPTYPMPSWMTRRPDSGETQQKRRWRSQAQTSNPYQPRLTRWAQAPSYGSSTPTLPTAGVAGSPYGAY